MRPALIAAMLLALFLTTVPAAADGSDDQTAAGQAPWIRSIVCPVLYTHEVGSQALLRRFLSVLVGAGYQPTSLATVDAAMTGAMDPPRGCVVLSFDDGLLSQFLNGVPVFTDLGIPAVFFVLPGFNDGVHHYMGIAEFQAIANAGLEVELHTCNHPNLALLARRDLSAFFAEVQDCKHILEGIIGESVDYIAYPFGSYDATVVDAVARFGFRGGFGTRASALLTYSSPYTLPRIHYDLAESPANVLRRLRAAGG